MASQQHNSNNNNNNDGDESVLPWFQLLARRNGLGRQVRVYVDVVFVGINNGPVVEDETCCRCRFMWLVPWSSWFVGLRLRPGFFFLHKKGPQGRDEAYHESLQ
jgi:hypothetical protein